MYMHLHQQAPVANKMEKNHNTVFCMSTVYLATRFASTVHRHLKVIFLERYEVVSRD